MIIYETDIFTAKIVELIDDDSYADLQSVLVADPEAGHLIPRSKGLRKIRWRSRSKGKRGGIRVIYYLVHHGENFMVYAYSKSKQEDISPEQAKVLRELVDLHLK